ncbi:MAG: DsbA family protein [Candidatus Portnoybacteria bacterium]|nr:DsbA family protein [Candidatus Portnoybacteria bacterium]
MESTNSTKNSIYILAALCGAILIIYGAFYYTGIEQNSKQGAQVLPTAKSDSSIDAKSAKSFKEVVLGDKKAPVTIIEYASYLCGHCVTFYQNTFPKVEENYIKTGKVKFIYRPFPPLEIGMALACAWEQNKFWEYNHEAYNTQIGSPDDLKIIASKIGADAEEFNKCFDSEKYKSVAENWYKEAQDANVEGTPTFFINDKKIVGDLPYEDFQKAIDEALAK